MLTHIQIEVFYVSDSNQLSSLSVDGNSYAMRDLGKNYSTAIDTRSLSVGLITGSNPTNASANTITNLALLYYENPSGNVSVLLQRRNITEYQWFDISSQSSQSLPDGFRNNDNEDGSHTLCETSAYTIFAPPFTSQGNYSISYAPRNASFVRIGYNSGPIGPGIFSTSMHCISSSAE